MSFYLNASSTDFESNHTYNPSDKALPPVMAMLDEWDNYEEKVKQYIHAPSRSKVVIVSGATEAIATLMHWTAQTFKSGIVWGSEHDHATVRFNAKNYGLEYSTDNVQPSRCVAIVCTHADPKSGEIQEVPKPKSIRGSFGKPLLFLDASQSITKVPIEMEKWECNAVFFSLHKLGGRIGSGLMVIDDRHDAPYVPLICGYQQEGFRGGTYPLSDVLECKFFEHDENTDSRINAWQKGFECLKREGVDVYEPKSPHLYNTFLINIGKVCPLKVINAVAKLDGIYIGTSSACHGEVVKMGAPDHDEHIRISFKNSSDITDELLTRIAITTKRVLAEDM